MSSLLRRLRGALTPSTARSVRSVKFHDRRSQVCDATRRAESRRARLGVSVIPGYRI